MKRAQRQAREAADEIERAASGEPRWTEVAIRNAESMRRYQPDRVTAVTRDAGPGAPGDWVVVCTEHGETARTSSWGEILRRNYAHLRVWHGRTS